MTLSLQTPVCDLFGCQFPVVLAGMGGVARSELVAAVTEAGGFGFLGMVREPPQLIRDEIAAVRRRTERDFGVNLIPAATDPALLEAEVAACIEAEIFAVTLFWDLDRALVKRFRDAGILVVCQIGSVAEAVAAEDAGAAVLIAQGWEAGGHVRGTTSLHALLPEVVAKTNLPVLAAGGITDGRDAAAAMLLGAQGVVMGTAFLATKESFAHDFHKRRIVEAGPDQTVHTTLFHVNWPIGAPVRVLPNSTLRGERGTASDNTVIGAEGERPIYLYSTDSPLRSMTGDFEAMALYAGQGAGRITDIPSAGDRLRTVVEGAEATLARLAAPRSSTPVTGQGASSPVCYAEQADDAYMGYASRGEIATVLGEILAFTRAAARLCARLLSDETDRHTRTRAEILYAEQAHWRQVLLSGFRALETPPPFAMSQHYAEALAAPDAAAQLALIQEGALAARQRLFALLPKIRTEGLRTLLAQLVD